MRQQKPLTKIAIISDGLAGWMLAHLLARRGLNVTLIDTDTQPHTDGRYVDMGVPFLPNDPVVRHGLEFLEECFGIRLEIKADDTAPQTVIDGEIKPFIGFGDSRSSAVQPLSTFNISSQLHFAATPKITIGDLVARALEPSNFKVLPFSEVTALHFDGSIVQSVTINGQTDIAADAFIFLNTPKELLELAPKELIGAKTRSRAAKSPAWSRVGLQFAHPEEITSQKDLFFLLPNQPDHAPCVGQFFSAAREMSARSIWQTFVPAELAEDPAYVTDVLKDIRKLVKRSFANFSASPHEIVKIDPVASADLAWTLENRDFAEIAENFVFLPRLAMGVTGFAQSVAALSIASDRLLAAATEVAKTTPAILDETFLSAPQ